MGRRREVRFWPLNRPQGAGGMAVIGTRKKAACIYRFCFAPACQLISGLGLSFAASLAVLEAVRSQLATHLSSAEMPQTGLKWPNDVIVAGGKISGILLEVER